MSKRTVQTTSSATSSSTPHSTVESVGSATSQPKAPSAARSGQNSEEIPRDANMRRPGPLSFTPQPSYLSFLPSQLVLGSPYLTSPGQTPFTPLPHMTPTAPLTPVMYDDNNQPYFMYYDPNLVTQQQGWAGTSTVPGRPLEPLNEVYENPGYFWHAPVRKTSSHKSLSGSSRSGSRSVSRSGSRTGSRTSLRSTSRTDLSTAAGISEPDNVSTNEPSRTVYLGNVPRDITPAELLSHVRAGPIESVKINREKGCAFITFLEPSAAHLFHSDAVLKRLSIAGHDIKIGWSNSTPVASSVAHAVAHDCASRNMYLGNLPKDVTEDKLESELKKFGPIEMIKIVHKNGSAIAFVHFLSIATAIRAVASLSKDPAYASRKLAYGKDHCAFITRTQQQNAALYLGVAGSGNTPTLDAALVSAALLQQSAAAAAVATRAGGANNLGNRCIYLGNIHPDCTVEELCNCVRGGILQSVRLLRDKKICFVTFIDPASAAQFFALASVSGLTLRSRKLKVGWGKHSGPLPAALQLAVEHGATRNVYVGVDSGSTIGGKMSKMFPIPREQLEKDFGTFGELEQINFLEAKQCAFVNFTNIENAIKAIDRIKDVFDTKTQTYPYRQFRINYGKDRCGNTPRQFLPDRSSGESSENGRSRSRSGSRSGGKILDTWRTSSGESSPRFHLGSGSGSGSAGSEDSEGTEADLEAIMAAAVHTSLRMTSPGDSALDEMPDGTFGTETEVGSVSGSISGSVSGLQVSEQDS